MNVETAIATRRSYRFLQPVEITDEMVEKLAVAAQLAPSCFNNQPWRFVFVRDPAVRARFAETLSGGNSWAQAASMLMAVFTRAEDDCTIQEREYYLFDTGMATAQLMLQATELGLVTHAMAGFNEGEVKEVLGIPTDYRVITVIAVGKKAAEPSTEVTEKQRASEDNRPERLPLRSLVFYDMVS